MSDPPYEARLTELIRTAEGGVQKVIAEAAGNGDYEAIETARRVAVELRALAQGLQGHQRSAEATHAAIPESGSGTVTVNGTDRPKGAATSPPPGRTTRAPRGKAGEYPRFEVHNGTLHRIGWSKKRKREYVHKVPRAAFDTIVDLLGRIAEEQDLPVPAEAVIDSLDTESREAIPTYQVYAVLMYLRQLDAIEHAGRDGYRIPADISQRKDTLWPS